MTFCIGRTSTERKQEEEEAKEQGRTQRSGVGPSDNNSRRLVFSFNFSAAEMTRR